MGSSRDDKEWTGNDFHFDQWKYHDAKVPFGERYELTINRDYKKEGRLFELVMQKYGTKNQNYNVVNCNGAVCTLDIEKAVEVSDIKGYTIFDWLTVMEQSVSVYTVEGPLATLINQLGTCRGKRSIFYPSSPNKTWKDRERLVLASDWKTVK